jgi:hypothetical protein
LQPYQYIRLQSRLVEGKDQPRRPVAIGEADGAM